MGMGETAENVASQIPDHPRGSRKRWRWKARSVPAAARDAGKLGDEIVPIETKAGTVSEDGTIRPDTTAEALAGLKPAFDASRLGDRRHVLAADRRRQRRAGHDRGVCPQAQPDDPGADQVGGDFGLRARDDGPWPDPFQPEGAGARRHHRRRSRRGRAERSLRQPGAGLHRDLGLDTAKTNIDGGAIAIGHPLGATGARIVGKAAALLKREGGKYALATQCIGGGQGIATVLEAVE